MRKIIVSLLCLGFAIGFATQASSASKNRPAEYITLEFQYGPEYDWNWLTPPTLPCKTSKGPVQPALKL